MSASRRWFHRFADQAALGRLLLLIVALALLPGVAVAEPCTVARTEPRPSLLNGTVASPGADAEERGLKTFPTQIALKVLAEAIRYGGPAADRLRFFLEKDRSAEKAFAKYSERIANFLEALAVFPDISTAIAKEKVREFCVDKLKLSHGTAGVIVEAVAGALIIST